MISNVLLFAIGCGLLFISFMGTVKDLLRDERTFEEQARDTGLLRVEIPPVKRFVDSDDLQFGGATKAWPTIEIDGVRRTIVWSGTEGNNYFVDYRDDQGMIHRALFNKKPTPQK